MLLKPLKLLSPRDTLVQCLLDTRKLVYDFTIYVLYHPLQILSSEPSQAERILLPMPRGKMMITITQRQARGGTIDKQCVMALFATVISGALLIPANQGKGPSHTMVSWSTISRTRVCECGF